MKWKVLLAPALLILFITACQEENQQTPSSQRASNTGDYETSIQDLSKWIILPDQPLKAKWKIERLGEKNQSRLPGPTDYKLKAIIEFDKKTADKIKKEAKEPDTGVGVRWDEKDFKDWYPPEMKDHFGKDEMFPEFYSLKSPYYSPDLFIKESLPLREGYFFFVDENTIYLDLTTM